MKTLRSESPSRAAIGRWLGRWLERRAAARRAAHDRALLRTMNGRDLADIGIGAGEIEALLLNAAPYRACR